MLARLGTFFLRSYIGWQIAAFIIWIGIELAGYGFGVLDALFRRPLTNAEGRRPLDLVVGAPPAGPMRLTRDEQAAVAKRLSDTFGASIPKHDQLADLQVFYQLAPGSLCDWKRGTNIAFDPKECNKLASSDPFFLGLLQNMHPKTQHVFWREAKASSGGTIQVGFFIGLKGKPQILFDFSRVGPGNFDLSRGFPMLVHHAGGTGSTDFDLGQPLGIGARLYLIDDPGTFPRRNASCDQPACFARIHLYAYLGDGTGDSMGRPVRRNLADVALDADLERRFAFYAALQGKAAPASTAARIETKYEITDFAVTRYELAMLKRKFDEAMGDGAFERAVFAPVAYHVAFGKVFGIRLDGKFYVIFEAAISNARLGTDKPTFRLADGRTSTLVEGVKSAREVHVLPYPGAGTAKSGTRLLVFKANAPDGTAGAPWSEFDRFDKLFAGVAGG